MRRLKFYLLLIAVVFTACSEEKIEKDTQKMISDIQEIAGEWVSPNSSNTYYTYFELQKNFKATYMVVQNEKGSQSVSFKDEGSWRLYSDRLELVLALMKQIVPSQELMEFEGDQMSLRNTKYNTVDKYYRVVESLTLDAGQKVSISYLQTNSGFAGAECVSMNPDVATVSDDGVVRGIQEGTTFISIKSGDALVYAKVKVNGRIERFAEETHLLITDILEKYGMPSGVFNVDDTKDGLYYLNPSSDPDMYALQYQYNKDTYEIRMVQTVYNDPTSFLTDWQYFEDLYYRQSDMSGYFYTQNELYWDNEFTATVRIQNSDPKYWIVYYNLDYAY